MLLLQACPFPNAFVLLFNLFVVFLFSLKNRLCNLCLYFILLYNYLSKCVVLHCHILFHFCVCFVVFFIFSLDVYCYKY